MTRRTRIVHAAPVVKAVGGKTRLLPELIARMPSSYHSYWEPFAGGLALYFHEKPWRVGGRVGGCSTVSDANPHLMAMYRGLVKDVDAVISDLRAMNRLHSERHYFQMRHWINECAGRASDVDRASVFIYLNKTCYNGLWRVNRSGAFNVPMGRYADAKICEPKELRAASAALSHARVICGDYRAVAESAAAGDFVYFDPPYDGGTFTGYTAERFGDVEQAELAFMVRTLAARGCQVMVSNADTARIRALYAGMRIDVVECARPVNSDGRGRGKVKEVIITAGYDPPGKGR